MKAWEIAKKILVEAEPRVVEEEDQTWDAMEDVEKSVDFMTRLLWKSNVPGSQAPESLMVASVQAMENRGYIVDGGVELIEAGFEAYENNDIVKLNKISSELQYRVHNAKKDNNSSYWKYKYYNSFSEYKADVEFIKPVKYDVSNKDFYNKVKGSWYGQLIGAGLGTAVEGYTTENIRRVFGEINDYTREPNTYNDDITFELAFLKAFEQSGYNITSKDIALEWVGLIPSGWSAEEIALRSIRYGIMPPESGTFNNPYNEWIGAQMRGVICGVVAPGNCELAAELAWKDGEVSHANNGIIGEIFNAIMASLAFVENDIRKVVTETIKMIPKESEIYQVIDYAINRCYENENWEDAWGLCEKEFEKYNWIHAYPNIAAEIIALWYGNGDFNKTVNIISMEGQDVDCNAAQILSILGTITGYDNLPTKWIDPKFEDLLTYVRTMKKMKTEELIQYTCELVKNNQ